MPLLHGVSSWACAAHQPGTDAISGTTCAPLSPTNSPPPGPPAPSNLHPPAGWIAGLSTLTRLSLSNNKGKLYLTDSLKCLRGLRELRLACAVWIDYQGLCTPLPPGLSRLELEVPSSEILLQVSAPCRPPAAAAAAV